MSNQGREKKSNMSKKVRARLKKMISRETIVAISLVHIEPLNSISYVTICENVIRIKQATLKDS